MSTAHKPYVPTAREVEYGERLSFAALLEHLGLGCRACIIQGDGFGPRHWPSEYCRSGQRPHCTCDTCF